MAGRLGQTIYDVRFDRGLTQEQAAAEIGVTRVTFDGWEKGGGVSARNMPKLARWLDLSVEHVNALARGEEPPGRRDSDVITDLKVISRNLERVTKRLIELDAENQRNAERLSRLEAAMIEALSRRL